MRTPDEYIKEVARWASSSDNIFALALVGSHARGEARPDSDIDFIILCNDREKLLNDPSWIRQFGGVASYKSEHWGIVTSLRVFYRDGQEIEFGLAPIEWAAIPVDTGTRQVVSKGIQVLKDSNSLLDNLVNTIKEE